MGRTAIFADLNSAQAFDLSRLDNDQIDYYRGVPMVANAEISNAFLAFRSPYDVQHPNRPYLHLMGYLDDVEGNMPYDITKFVPKHRPYSDIIYEFSNNELANLVDKGLYERDFKVPDKLATAKLKIPVTCDFALVKPDKEANTVLVYGKIKNAENLAISSKNTDYVFANDFEKAESLLPHKDTVKQQENSQADELEQNSLDFDEPTNSLTFEEPEEVEANNNLVFDNEDTQADVLDLGDDEANETSDHTAVRQAEKHVQDMPNPVKTPSKEELEADKVLKRAQKHMAKRKEKIKKASENKAKQVDKPKEDENLKTQLILQAGRQSKIANEIAADEKNGVVEETVPDTPNDFDAIGDEDYGKHQSTKERRRAEKKAMANGEINEAANKKALSKHRDIHKSIQDLDAPVPVDDTPDDSLDL